jgi:hypothetical protein
MNDKFLRAKESEIGKAGRLVFDALFGETEDLQTRLGDELDREAASRGKTEPILVEAHSFVRCDGCAREQIVPPDVDVRTLTQRGWRLSGGAWRCSFCVSK